MPRNIFGEFQRGGDERPLTNRQQGRRDRDVARVMADAARRHGPADNPDDVVAQKMYLVRTGQVSAREAFAPRPRR